MPYAASVILKLFVLVALAFSLGDSRDMAEVDVSGGQSIVSLLETDPEPSIEVFVVEPAIAGALPRVFGVHVIGPVKLTCFWDPAGVFRPPRSIG